MTDQSELAALPGRGYVPVRAGDAVVGRAYLMDDGTWCARMTGGTILGYHAASINAVAAILARHNAPGQREPATATGSTIP